MALVLHGPWKEQPMTWLVSVNGGASAFSVCADSESRALAAGYARLYDQLVGPLLDADGEPRDPFAYDTAQTELAALAERLQVYTPQAWTAKCHAELIAERGGLFTFYQRQRAVLQGGAA